jgi:O-antigen/teichoic acid export membrane protein
VEAKESPLARPNRQLVLPSLGVLRSGAWRLARTRTAQQAAAFVVANLLANALAVVSTALVTRNLSTADFGSYSFAASFLLFVAIFFEFGLFFPAARIAAVADADTRRDIVGSSLVVYVPVGIAFAATIFALSFVVDQWFHVEAGHALRIAAPFAVGIPFTYEILQLLAQGIDRLHIASIATAFAQLLLVALFVLWLGVVGGFSTSSALLLRVSAFLITVFVSAAWLQPGFRAVRHWTRQLIRQAREWGFQLFVGRVLSIGTYNMDVLMLGIWTDSRSVGFYALAGSLAAASGLPVTGMAAALFPRMARASAIPREFLTIAFGVGTVCAIAVSVLAEPVIRLLFSARYVDAASLVLPLALAQLVRGVTGIFNTFLSGHGRGKDLRNAGFVLTGSNIAFNFALIPPFGAAGAAWASLLALGANFIAHVVFYRRAYERHPADPGQP